MTITISSSMLSSETRLLFRTTVEASGSTTADVSLTFTTENVINTLTILEPFPSQSEVSLLLVEFSSHGPATTLTALPFSFRIVVKLLLSPLAQESSVLSQESITKFQTGLDLL
jgi:hypothetical protein